MISRNRVRAQMNVKAKSAGIETDVLYSASAIGTQILLKSEGKSVLVDVGDGTVRDLTSRGFDFGSLIGVLITHEHADHTGGLFSLLHFMKHMPKTDPLRILTPRPAKYLAEFVKPPLMYSKPPFEIKVVEVEEGVNVELGPFFIQPFRTAHVDLSSIGYSIRDPTGYRVVVSGDTVATARLRQAVLGADLAILESTFEDGQEEYAKEFGHMTLSQAKSLGKLAKKTLLVHQMPQDYFRVMTCAAIKPNGSSTVPARARPAPRRRHRR